MPKHLENAHMKIQTVLSQQVYLHNSGLNTTSRARIKIACAVQMN